MLLYNFFTFTEIQAEGNTIKANIELNVDHAIFKGHFPGQPVLPGACMMQMVKEMVENHISEKIKLLKANELKFLSLVDPHENKLIQLDLKINMDEDRIRIEARLLDNAIVFFKFKGIFVRYDPAFRT